MLKTNHFSCVLLPVHQICLKHYVKVMYGIQIYLKHHITILCNANSDLTVLAQLLAHGACLINWTRLPLRLVHLSYPTVEKGTEFSPSTVSRSSRARLSDSLHKLGGAVCIGLCQPFHPHAQGQSLDCACPNEFIRWVTPRGKERSRRKAKGAHCYPWRFTTPVCFVGKKVVL